MNLIIGSSFNGGFFNKIMFALAILILISGCGGNRGSNSATKGNIVLNEPAAAEKASEQKSGQKELQQEAKAEKKEILSITSVNPKSEDNEVTVDQPVFAEFNLNLNEKTSDKDMMIISKKGNKIKGSVIVEGKKVTFKPEVPLPVGEKYFAILKKGVKSSNGIVLKDEYKWSFETVAVKLPKVRVFAGDSIILSDIAKYDFFDQGVSSASEPAVFKVQNEGAKPLVVSSISLLTGDSSQFGIVSPQLPMTIQPKGSFMFKAVFKPQTMGKKSVGIRIKNSDEDFGNFNFVLTGNGI